MPIVTSYRVMSGTSPIGATSGTFAPCLFPIGVSHEMLGDMRQHGALHDEQVLGGMTGAKGRFWHFGFPLRRAEQLDSMRGSRRGLFESHGKARCVCLPRSSSAVASSSQAAQGHPENSGRDSRGGLPLVTFLGRARKVTSCRAAPGLASLRLLSHPWLPFRLARPLLLASTHKPRDCP